MLSIAQLLGPIEPFDILTWLCITVVVFVTLSIKNLQHVLIIQLLWSFWSLEGYCKGITPPLVAYRAKIFALLKECTVLVFLLIPPGETFKAQFELDSGAKATCTSCWLNTQTMNKYTNICINWLLQTQMMRANIPHKICFC